MRDFFQAAVPEPVTLLGQQLAPFSIGHWILLERFECAYIAGGPATIPDLMLGVLVCCHKHDEFISLARNESIFQLTKKWSKRIGNFDFPKKSKEFSDYIDDAIHNLPKYWVEERKGGSAGRKSGAPYIQTLRAFLLSKTSLTENEILNRPFALSVWDMTTILELDGSLRINSREDDELTEQATAFEKHFDGLTEQQKSSMRGEPVNN